jgi:hypothetical protein
MPWRRMAELTYSSTSLNLGTRWRKVVSFTHMSLYVRRKILGTFWKESGWPQIRLDAVAYGKFSFLCRESNPGHQALNPLLYRLSYPGFSFFTLMFIFSTTDLNVELLKFLLILLYRLYLFHWLVEHGYSHQTYILLQDIRSYIQRP